MDITPLADALRHARKDVTNGRVGPRLLSLHQLAERTGYSILYVSEVETGRRIPAEDYVRRVAAVTGGDAELWVAVLSTAKTVGDWWERDPELAAKVLKGGDDATSVHRG